MKALLLTEYKSMSYTDVPSPVCGCLLYTSDAADE